jgi:hypothetical protein
MKIPFEVEWVSTPEQGAVAARILEPREFTLTPTAAIEDCPIRDVEPGERADLFAFFLENESEVVRFFRGQRIALRV